MAAGWPTKANYATGDVLSATNMNDLSGTVNYIDPTSATDGQVLTRDAASAGKVKWATAGGASGLTLISRQSFSNVAGTGTTFDGVFTSTYKTYLVAIETIVGTTYADDLQLQFRYAGPTTAVTNYYGSSITTDYSISTVSNTQTSNASQATLNLFIGTDTSTPTSGYLFFQNVGNSAQKGYYQGSFFNADSFNLNVVGGANNNPRTYTGFLLKSSSTNVTGTVAVYGMATA